MNACALTFVPAPDGEVPEASATATVVKQSAQASAAQVAGSLSSEDAAAIAAAARVVVVAGATGRVGDALVRELRARGGDGSASLAVALARDKGKARAKLGEDVLTMQCDLRDIAALRNTLGALRSKPWRLFLACGNTPDQGALETNLLTAAEENGCEYVVKLSTVRTALEAKLGGYIQAHSDVERALMESKVPYRTVLRPNLFMQMLESGPLGLGSLLKSADSCRHPFANSPVSMIDVRDVAATAAILLLSDDASGYDGRTLDLTGGRAVSARDCLDEAVSPLRPRPVDCEEIPLGELVGGMGLPDGVAERLQAFFAVIAGSDFVTSSVEEVTGRPARSVRQFVADNPLPFLPGNFSRLVGRQRGDSFRAEAMVEQADTSEALEALKPNEVLVKVLVAGVNGGADSFRIINAGAEERRFGLGVEGAGRVVAVGANVSGVSAFDVVTFVGGLSFAEYATVDAERCLVVPESSRLEELVALRVSGLTAAVALRHTAPVKAGDVVLVTAACGATGSFAVQVAKWAGATVIGTVSSAEKAMVAKELGCDRVVNYKEEDLGSVLRAEFPSGVDIAYDGVGGKLFRAAHDNLAEGGRILLVGAISTYPHNASPQEHGVVGLPHLMEIFRKKETVSLGGGRNIIGNVWGNSFETGAMLAERDWLLEQYERGAIRALVSSVGFRGVGSVVDAVDYMLGGANVGKTWVQICE